MTINRRQNTRLCRLVSKEIVILRATIHLLSTYYVSCILSLVFTTLEGWYYRPHFTDHKPKLEET